jgi:HPt (histidine-containing phosphotransfer) domain-containing protein
MPSHPHDPSGPSADAAPLLRYAQALQAVGGPEVIASLLPVLLKTLDDDTLRLGSALADGESAPAAVVLHGLKGVLPMFCSTDMAHSIQQLEALCKSAALPEARAAWPALRAQMLLLREEVRVIIEKAA